MTLLSRFVGFGVDGALRGLPKSTVTSSIDPILLRRLSESEDDGFVELLLPPNMDAVRSDDGPSIEALKSV